MTATRFKVGDKVKVRKRLVGGRYYDGVYCTSDMANSAGEIFMISAVNVNTYKLESYDLWWTDEMLEPVEKTLDNLCAGDFVKFNGGIRKILAAVDGCYLLSYVGDYISTGFWYTVDELEEAGYIPTETDIPEPTIKINGKKYNKSDVEKAIQGLETID